MHSALHIQPEFQGKNQGRRHYNTHAKVEILFELFNEFYNLFMKPLLKKAVITILNQHSTIIQDITFNIIFSIIFLQSRL
ncbi:MAG TPA: hypothetical protein DEO70_14675 [Bacteroidales bacterium]|nr:MAG: hypothetical protein A2X11_06520 [Bacteroidetes bacterium GWE2_42_24]OFY25666.1 MAG: hypothetical protein A2X09_01745 [Bacteroidetes bacterium GWF2_43_11]HBZ68075.1 hypothetical protein [Bacteroidales bacterium]